MTLKAIFHSVQIFAQADIFRAENSWWKNIINFHFPRGLKEKKKLKKHYSNNTTNLDLFALWKVKLL